jgi:hypothetical protein
VIGVVESSTTNTFVLVYEGKISGLSGLTSGQIYFLSASTAGASTTTEPATVGQVSKPILYATSTTTANVVSYRGYVITIGTSGTSGSSGSSGVSGGGYILSSAPGSAAGVAVNSASAVDLGSKSITVSAGDTVIIELDGTALNNSGGTVTYTAVAALGTFTVSCADGATMAASATNRSVYKFRAVFVVRSTSDSVVTFEAARATPGASNTGASSVATQTRSAWNTSASNFTGTQTVKIQLSSSSTTATQTFFVNNTTVTKYPTI